MSVIFKTLKKLKTESMVTEDSKSILVGRKKIYFFQDARYSPAYIILLLFILTVVGAGTLYGYYHLRETTDENIKDYVIPNTDIQKFTDEDTSEGLANKETKYQKETKASESSRIEYIPPTASNNQGNICSSKKPDDAEIPFKIAKKTPPKVKEATKKNVVAKTTSEKADKPVNKEVLPVPEVEKIFLANAKKNAKIARLVADIRWEMGNGNKRTEKYLDELALLKGQDNSYVLKLKAVWHIHNKEFERAKDLLKRVLTKNELDQEAGINMAIIEINTKQMENAYHRLSKLQTVYPEDIRIAEIMQDLTRLFKKTQKHHLNRDKRS
jgi:hypothetical protein